MSQLYVSQDCGIVVYTLEGGEVVYTSRPGARHELHLQQRPNRGPSCINKYVYIARASCISKQCQITISLLDISCIQNNTQITSYAFSLCICWASYIATAAANSLATLLPKLFFLPSWALCSFVRRTNSEHSHVLAPFTVKPTSPTCTQGKIP